MVCVSIAYNVISLARRCGLRKNKNSNLKINMMRNENMIEPLNPQCVQTSVSGSATPNFLKVAVDELLTYRTPKKIVDYIKAEKMKAIIGNPPYDVSGHYR